MRGDTSTIDVWWETPGCLWSIYLSLVPSSDQRPSQSIKIHEDFGITVIVQRERGRVSLSVDVTWITKSLCILMSAYSGMFIAWEMKFLYQWCYQGHFWVLVQHLYWLKSLTRTRSFYTYENSSSFWDCLRRPERASERACFSNLVYSDLREAIQLRPSFYV